MAETPIWPQSEDDSEFKPLDVHEFMERAAAEKREFLRTLKYWQYLKDANTLRHIKMNYEVDLDRINSAEEYLG